MRIGIDISQIVHEGTGVAVYVSNLVRVLIRTHPEHQYVLFGSSFRKRHVFSSYVSSLSRSVASVRLVSVPIPPTMLEWIWNTMHIIPIEWFTGPLDVFWSSDWTQPPLAKAIGITTIHDLSVLRYPDESYKKIVETQKRRLRLASRDCQVFFCDSEATKQDVHELLGIDEYKLSVVYPGL